MIAYFDTSALIPLVVEEAGSDRATRVWDAAERVVTVRIACPEGRAALAQARRLGRLTARGHRSARAGFEDLWRQLDRVEVTAALAERAGDLAESLGLRGYDAVHLAAAETVADRDLVLVAGDGPLCDAARALGLAITRT
ncbi:MAG: type II toxin-antitoxin system VapC family toxin [Acidimicrobiia bacterium]